MAEKTIRTILALDGEKQFRQKLTQINSQLSVMKTNLKDLTAQYDLNGKSVKNLKNQKNELQSKISALKQKQTTLTEGFKASQRALRDANKEHQEAIVKHGAESNEAKRLEAAILKLQQRCNNYQNQLTATNAEIRNTQRDLHAVNSEIAKSSFGAKLAKELGEVSKVTAKLGFEGLKESVKAVSKEVEIAAKAFAGYTAAITATAGAITAFAYKSGADFEEGMSGVEAISGATAEQMDKLSEKALTLGANTKFTAKEVSDGFNYMAMAGWSAEDMLSGIDGVINLAAASGEDLGLVSDIVTDSLTAFGMEASDASRYSDILAQAATNANTNVAMMGETFQYCAPIAGAMGYKVDDMATAIGVMANAGIKGSMAGTSLRSIITNLAAPTDASAAAMEKMGIEITDAEGNMKPFNEVVGQLREGFAGLSEAEQAAAAKAIAGKPGMSGLLAIVNTSEEDFNKLSAAVGNCYGAAKQMADIKLDNLKGDITYLKSATEGLGATLFDTLNNKMRKGVQSVTSLVSKLNDGIRFGRDMNAVFKDIVANIKVLADRAMKSLADNLPTFTAGFNTVVLGLVDILIDQLPVITQQILPELFTGFSQLVQGLAERIPEVLPVLITAAKDLLVNILTGMNLIQTGFDIVMTLCRSLVENAPELLEAGTTALIEFINGVVDNLPELISLAIELTTYVLDAILDNLDPILKAGLELLIALSESIVEHLDTLLDYIPKIVETIVDVIIDNLDLIIKAALEICIALGTALVECAVEILNVVPDICKSIGEKFEETDWKQVGRNIMDGIFGGVNELAEKAKEKLGGAIGKLKDGFCEMFDIHSPSKWAKDVIGKNLVLGQIEGMEETAAREENRMFSALSGFGKILTSTASDLIPSGAGAVVSVNLYGPVTLNNTDNDLDNLIIDIETRISDRVAGRGV